MALPHLGCPTKSNDPSLHEGDGHAAAPDTSGQANIAPMSGPRHRNRKVLTSKIEDAFDTFSIRTLRSRSINVVTMDAACNRRQLVKSCHINRAPSHTIDKVQI